MFRKAKFSATLLVVAGLVVLTFAVGCSGGLADRAGTGAEQLPFGQVAPAPAIEISLPAGTPFPVRLQAPISSATASAGDRFSAFLDDDLQLDGNTVAPRGTRITGRVLAVGRFVRARHPGYLRITLSEITLRGKQVPLETSSIFVHGRDPQARNPLAKVSATGTFAFTAAETNTGARKEANLDIERRLTFRLVQPLLIRS